MLQSVGKLRYSPKLNGSLQRRDGGSTKWWLVIDVDPEIGKYYRELYYLSRYKVEKIQRPAWEAHISVIRDEPPLDKYKKLWEKYNGVQINFEYDPMKSKCDETYVWFPVKCDRALEIREELGLSRQPFFPLHLTIGNFKG